MKCPHCDQDLPGKTCPYCEAEIPEESVFCMYCGKPASLPEPSAEGGDDWDNRVLCSDGTCIGVIGPDGRCKECGKPYDPNAEED